MYDARFGQLGVVPVYAGFSAIASRTIQAKKKAEQRQKMLLVAGGAVVLLGMGAFIYWRKNRSSRRR